MEKYPHVLTLNTNYLSFNNNLQPNIIPHTPGYTNTIATTTHPQGPERQPSRTGLRSRKRDGGIAPQQHVGQHPHRLRQRQRRAPRPHHQLAPQGGQTHLLGGRCACGWFRVWWSYPPLTPRVAVHGHTALERLVADVRDWRCWPHAHPRVDRAYLSGWEGCVGSDIDRFCIAENGGGASGE